MRYISSLTALALFLMLATPALAGTIHAMGTNVTNAQSNVSKYQTNASVTVTAWTPGIGTKTLAVKGYNASESLTFVLYNFTPSMTIERKENGTSKQAYQANSTGAITFNTTQDAKNVSYSFTPAVNVGGYNSTWGFFFDIQIKNGTLENVNILSAVKVNVTTFNATTVQGDGYGLSNLNLNNGTGTLPKQNMPANMSYNDSKMTKIYAYNATDQLNLVNAVPTKINLTTEGQDDNGEYDPALSRFTATNPGNYQIDAQICFANVAASTPYIGYLYVNGGYVREQYAPSNSAGNAPCSRISTGIKLAVGDYVELYGESVSGNNNVDIDSAGNAGARTFMTIHFLSRDSI